ncbi:DNA-binding transcriptional regulator, MocR family, contains an aminotransferase domain [Marinobacter persicus]|uniref:DNA-binding transcriptional regulator, MocR family, contains an aminotransferase domain n=1 Tax=Marinobacter persicus TaxID=930118 RepID=A0A1I3V4N6_9GAMM|nr:DNA-binding transcriptional regulator, MocR family, contains an aminotransferase domain [Marinobacter persicus]
MSQGIADGRWPSHSRLPSIRELCARHGVSKATVQHALRRLEARGVVEARPKSGYFVTRLPEPLPPPRPKTELEAPRPVTISHLLLDIMARNGAFDLKPAPETGEAPYGITALNRAIGRALRRQRRSNFQYYDEPAGDAGFREQLALRYNRRGWPVTADELCVTSGCQHALFLALMACCQAGDVVAVETPGFYGVLQLLEQLNLKVIEIPARAETGMDMDALAQALERWDIRACVVSPAFATPGGALMPDEARARLISMAEDHNLAVIEDDIYAESGFEHVPDPLKARDRNGRVIHCSSFSKVLSRDLRLGWIAGGRWHDRILHLKLVTQLASSRYLQQGVADFMREGALHAHLRRERLRLREQRDELLGDIRQWPGTVGVSVPQGGLALWLELPDTCDTLAVYQAALQAGIVITPGPLFSASGDYTNGLRLSFAHPWNDRRRGALQRLPALLGLH